MKLDFKSLAQRKKNLKYGGYSAILTLIVAAVLAVAVVLCELLSYKIDLTPNQLYTVSDSTKEVIQKLDDDVVIYGCFQTGSSEYTYYASYIDMVVELVENYQQVSSHVSYETVDTLKHPETVKAYMGTESTTIQNGTFIIVNKTNNKFRILEISDFYEFTDSTATTPDTFAAEEAITTAIQYVTSEVNPVLYQLTGHSEVELDSTFEEYMITTNYDFETINLKDYSEDDEIEVNGYSVICINSPGEDLDDFEYSLLLDYMERGGRMIVFLSTKTDSSTLPNFNKLLARYGISYDRAENTSFVYDTNQSHYYYTPYIVKNQMSTSSEITTELGKSSYSVLMSAPVHMTVGESTGNNTEFDIFLQTYSSASYVADAETEEIVTGAFPTGVAVSEEKTLSDGIVETRLVVFANSYFIDYTNEPFGGYGITTGNYQVVASALNYLQDGVDGLYISSKSLSYATFTPSASDFLLMGGIFVVVIPTALIVIGMIIWRKRKNL